LNVAAHPRLHLASPPSAYQRARSFPYIVASLLPCPTIALSFYPNPVVVTAHYCFNSFSCNTYGSPRKCCKQKIYGLAKPFRCNIYKNTGGGSRLWLTRFPMRKSVLRSMATKDLSSHPLRIHSDENSFFAQVLSFHIVAHSFARTGTQLFYFQAVPHSLPKNTGGRGYPLLLKSATSAILESRQ